MPLFRQSPVRHPAAALRLVCAVLVALWALSTAPLAAPGAPSLAKPARELAMLAAKRPAAAVAQLATARPAKHHAGSPDLPGLAAATLRQRVVAQNVVACDPGPGVIGEPRSPNLARAPPLSAAA